MKRGNTNSQRPVKKRHIADVPLYTLKHQKDDLPLDPAKPFILEEIGKLKQTLPQEFNQDLDLFSYQKYPKYYNQYFDVTNINKGNPDDKYWKDILVTNENLEFSSPWSHNDEFENSPQQRSERVSTQIKNILMGQRRKIVRKKIKRHPTMRRLSGITEEDLMANRTNSFHKFRLSFEVPPKKKRSKVRQGDDTRMWAPRELRSELTRIGKVIDKLIEPDMKRYEEEQRIFKIGKTPQETSREPSSKQIIRTKVKKSQNLTAEEFLKMQKKKELEKLRYFQPLMPMKIEEQRQKMQDKYNQLFHSRFIRFSEVMQIRTQSLIDDISVCYFEKYPSHLIISVLPLIDDQRRFLKNAFDFIQNEQRLWPNIHPEIILMDYLYSTDHFIKQQHATMVMSLLLDLQTDFRFHISKKIIKDLLHSEIRCKQLQLEPEPPDFPVMTIKAPIPWKSSVQVATNKMDQTLMITHPVLQAVNMLWHELYNDILIVDTAKLFKDDIPMDSKAITEFIHNCCLIARDILLNDWLPRVADLIEAMRDFWIDLVSFNTVHGGRAAIMFKTIHALMSFQLQGLIKRSIDNLYDVIKVYSDGNEIDKYSDDNTKLKKRPFMTLIVSVVGKYSGELDNKKNTDSILYQIEIDDPSILSTSLNVPPTKALNSVNFIIKYSGKMFVEPYMEELPNLFVSYFKKILKVGYNIPRMEYFMSQEKSQFGYLHCIPEDHVDMLLFYEKVQQIVINNQTGPTTYLYPIYKYYFPILAGKMQAITEGLFLKHHLPELSAFKVLMDKFQELLRGVNFLKNYVSLNLFMLDNRRVNQVLTNMINEMKDFIADYFKTKNQVENRKICDEFEEISLHAGERPKETPEVVALQNYLTECRDNRLYVLKTEIRSVAERVIFLIYHATLENEDIHLNNRTFLWPNELEQVLELSAARLNVVRDNLETALKERRTNFEIFLQTEKKKMDSFRMREIRDVLSLEELKERVETVDKLTEILQNCSKEAKIINTDENLLQIDQSFFPVLTELIEKMEPIEKLWHTAYHFDCCYEIWYYGSFQGLDADKIREEVENMWKIMYKLTKALITNPQAKRIAEQVRLKIDKFKIYLPILEAICRQGLTERHWNQISDVVGQPINSELFPTLSSLIDIDIMKFVDKLEEISNAAGKEHELNIQLEQMQSEWTDVQFEVTPYRDSDTHILASIDDVQTLLDDHILKAQAMRGSPFIAALGEKATKWEEKLISMQDILDIWLQVQSTWMYLEPIFSSEDIMRQMPSEGRNFKAVDRVWRKIMQHTVSERHVIEATNYPNMFDTLRKSFESLEEIQKGLNMYLEKKRLFFARFYFLSNDELLEILSETKDPLRVQPHLKKCFEGINSLEFDNFMEITGMLSVEEERVPFTKKINPATANGLVEKWLKDVQVVMLESVLEQLHQAYDTYYHDSRKDWSISWPGQVIQCISCLTWTSEVEEAIEKKTLPDYLEKCNQQIADTVDLVRGDLSSGAVITIEALIVLDVHARDIVKLIIENNVQSIGDFNWFAQLRYYWKVDEADKAEYVCVSMVTTDVKYGLEYLGNVPRLVVTPLTDRCFRTLLGALQLNLGGAPEGPAGTGKTETCKDLAKAVAKKCVVFNCSEGLDYKALGKFFKGLAQSGSWACFDEFNRIDLEVLSVVAQQILTIQRAIAKKVVAFYFEDSTLKLDPTCTIFITMNPGYAGRTELPDNLKVLFRTVAMMVPDYAMIGEITLYSNGFDNARPLAQKIVHTYKLCSEQLSSQHHYDYGMRAVKSVLLASGSLRRSHPEYSESQIVLRAIIDVNLPKFLQQDVPLFEGIYNDLFPGVEIPCPEREDIRKWLQRRIQDKKLQPTPWFMEKVLQIYEMLLVRHGLMIVGPTMSGKTTAYQLLAEVLRDISKDATAKSKELGASFRIINPKSITLGQLYGNFDPFSHEWIDGILAKTFREMAYSTSCERQWIIFDGPVDAVWIENLNTVLDDNKKLCLMSGEIIQMSKFMNLIFEPPDLEQASPATVSRCGMIYMESSQLGWETLHKSFIIKLTEMKLTEIYLSLYEALVDWLVKPMLEILETAKIVLRVSPLYMYKMLTKFFTVFLNKQPTYNQTWFQQTFLYCFSWAYGSTLTVEGRKQVDVQLRKILYGANENHPKPKLYSLNRGQMFPEKMNFLDYRFDGTESWWSWLKSEEVALPQDIPLTEIVIPTKESGYILNWLEFCVNLETPILLCGPTGTGKSVIVQNFMKELPKAKFLLNCINFSARTTAQQVQDLVMAKLDRRRKGVYGPPVGKKCLIFVEDVAMPSKDAYGSQSPLELLRQWLDHNHWSDLKDTTRLELIDLLFVGAMGLIGGSNFIYERLYRHSFVVSIDDFETSTIQRIFTAIGDWHFEKEFSENVSRLSKGLCNAIAEVYNKAHGIFLPTPTKSHYTFSLRDITRVYQGIVMVPPKRLQEPEKLIKLWAHETYRVFYDRLIDDTDRQECFNMIVSASYSQLRMPLQQAIGERIPEGESFSDIHMRELMFGNYMEPDAEPKIYDEIVSMEKLENVMQYYLNEYNNLSNSPMDLVLFRFAIEHISRICRVLQMPKGNVLLVGLGGSGRRSNVKLAASIANADLIQVEVTKLYSYNDWREDLKKILLNAGINYKSTVFLFCDSQAKLEEFVEDINSLLNMGDINNLFQADEKATILEKMQYEAKAQNKNIDSTPLALYGFFISRVRDCLHIALAFSPIGDSFKKRIRTFPSIINCCTIDWFSLWPKDALIKVAEHFISSMNLIQKSSISVVRSSSTRSINEDQQQVQPEAENESRIENKLIEMIMYFDVSVRNASEKYFKELGRRNYITATLYLEMLHLFKVLYHKKFNEITMQRDRYTTGLEKLDSAAGQVGVMQENLYELQPQLKILSEETEKIMVNIERETAEAEKKKEVVGADEAAANVAAASAQAIKDDCESDLQEAIPALEAALSALDTLKPADITIVKSMKNPPSGVKLVLEALCVIRGIKSDKKTDSTGKTSDDFWGPSVKMLGDLKFLESLKNFDKDNIPAPIMKRVRQQYMADRDFVPEKIKNVSTACEGLCRWVRAMEVYDRVAKIVAPKKLALSGAEAELAQQMEKLNAKRAELQEILDKLQKLNDFFAEKSREKKRLEDEIDNCEKKLFRAERLLGGLGGEKSRWSENAKVLHKSLDNVVGDVLLAAGSVAYLGCFTTDFRANIISDWNDKCLTKEIPCSTKFALATTLGNPMQIRSWSLCGLPSDNFSIENGIIVTNARRYPLMIDPQGQANKWVKNLEKDNNLQVIKQTDTNYRITVKLAVIQGLPLLLENVEEYIDSGLFPILERNVVKQKGSYFLKFGDEMIDYNFNFRFYITSCLRNPHYLPETAVLVTILNFMITEIGLREQLLATVVVQERPDLQEKKEILIVESAHNRDSLYNIETQILQVLTSSEGNILEDENAINILSSSKVLSEEIQAKQVIAVATEAEIDEARQLYLPVAQHSAILFFCITNLANIDPMYQYSLTWFLNLFIQTINTAPKSDILQERLNHLNKYFTASIYQNICRSLFEKDKLVFSFVMCIGILRSEKKINDAHLLFLLTEGISLTNSHENPAPEWLTDKSWDEIVKASELPGLENFHQIFAENIEKWKIFYELSDPQSLPFPEPYHELDESTVLIVLKCIRLDAIVPAVRKFIMKHLNDTFVEPPPFNLATSFVSSSPSTPLIFLLSPGSDPMTHLFAFAKERDMLEKIKTISLGQGQGPRAAKMIAESAMNGHWVVLQNCHVAESWMSELERIALDPELTKTAHMDYRLWCTSYPSKHFPILVLQNSVKMTNEPPKGLKMNMMRSFTSEPLNSNKFFSNAFKNDHLSKLWLRGVFSLVFFHAVIQERRLFGPLGWNIPYEFNESDLKISVMQLKMFLTQYETIPFEGHKYMTGECNYGGRVTDDKDRRLLLSLLDKIYNEDTVSIDGYNLSDSGNYKVPLYPDKTNCLEYIATLPLVPHPEVFGLHENADISKNNKETNELLSGVLLTQTELLAESKRDEGQQEKQDPVANLCREILNRLPPNFSVKQVTEKYPVQYTNSMNIVLRQEVIRFNRLLNHIKSSLCDVQRAVSGQIAMIPQLEKIHLAISIGKLPEDWLKKSYPSLKPLGSYINDLIARLQFFQNWIDNGEPNVYWLSGLYFTQSFITGVMQNYSRKHKLQIDLFTMVYDISDFESEASDTPELGVYVKENIAINDDFKCFDGLFLEGARWNRMTKFLDESYSKILYDPLPIATIKPVLKTKVQSLEDHEEMKKYECPIYRTSERRGVLSTTGHSTNFVMFMNLPTNKSPNHWTNRGTACLCQMDN